MEIKLSNGRFRAKLRGVRLVGEYGPRKIERCGLSDGDLREAIRNPIGCPPIRQRAKGCKKVVVVTDDITRPTPVRKILPVIFDELQEAEVSPAEVTILVGLGSHRLINMEEMEVKFGKDICGNFRIVNHRWNDPEQLVSLGECGLGFEVTVNRLAAESDFMISVGNIVPHATTGFSGGAKTVMTGIAGKSTIENTHWLALDYPMRNILGNYENRVRKITDKLARVVGLDMIVNTVLFGGDKVYGIFAGDFERVHREAAKLCVEAYGVEIGSKSDIVVAEAWPADSNLRQAIKGICSADLVCRDNGVIVLCAECPEGVAAQFPDFIKYGFNDPDGLYRKVQSGEFEQKLLAYTLVAIGRIISKRASGVLVCPNIDSATSEQLGFIPANSLEEGLDKACKIVGSHPELSVLYQAAVILPILSENTA